MKLDKDKITSSIYDINGEIRATISFILPSAIKLPPRGSNYSYSPETEKAKKYLEDVLKDAIAEWEIVEEDISTLS